MNANLFILFKNPAKNPIAANMQIVSNFVSKTNPESSPTIKPVLSPTFLPRDQAAAIIIKMKNIVVRFISKTIILLNLINAIANKIEHALISSFEYASFTPKYEISTMPLTNSL